MTPSGEVGLGVFDGIGKRTGDIGERSKDEIAERVAGQTLSVRKPVLKQPGCQTVLIGGHRDEAVADVSGREHPKLAAQQARGTAVVRHGDDGARVESHREQAVDNSRQPGAATDGDSPSSRADAHRTSRSRPMSRCTTTAR